MFFPVTQVFIRGGNYIATDWMLRWSAARYRTEVRMHAEVRRLPSALRYVALHKRGQQASKRAHGVPCAGFPLVSIGFDCLSLASAARRKGCACALVWDVWRRGVGSQTLSCPPSCSPSPYSSWALRQAGLNMIRLWGGAAVARDAFYDACDEAGILVRRISDKAGVMSAVHMGVLMLSYLHSLHAC